MKTALVFGAALALLAAPALAQYGGGAQNAGGPLGSYARRAGINYGYGGPYGGYAYGPYYGGYGAPAYSWAGRSTMATPAITAAQASSRRARFIRGGSIGRTRGSIGAGSNCCSAARPKAGRSTSPARLYVTRVGRAIPAFPSSRQSRPRARWHLGVSRPGGCCEPPAPLGNHIAHTIGFMPQSATKHVFRLNETSRLRLQGRRNHLATKRFFNPPSETPVQGD